MIRAALGAALLLAAPALAAEDAGAIAAVECGDATRADTIVEPWADNTATYAGGEVRIALLDMVEPAAAALKLLVISPPRDELGLRQCRVIGTPGGLGFADMDFAARSASYDPQRGLTIALPARMSLPEGDPDDGWFQLSLTLNQQTGQIAAQGFK